MGYEGIQISVSREECQAAIMILIQLRSFLTVRCK